MLLCDICNAGWHMNCFIHPLTTIPAGIWKCPLCTLTPNPRVHYDTSASPLPFETLTLIKRHLEKEKESPPIPCQYQDGGGADISGRKNNKMPRMRRWRAYDEGSGLNLKFSTVVRHGGNLGPRQTVFSFGFCFFTGDWTVCPCGPVPPHLESGFHFRL